MRPKVVDPEGEAIYAGKDEFAKALGLIKDGKPIRYEGVIGPVSSTSTATSPAVPPLADPTAR